VTQPAWASQPRKKKIERKEKGATCAGERYTSFTDRKGEGEGSGLLFPLVVEEGKGGPSGFSGFPSSLLHRRKKEGGNL